MLSIIITTYNEPTTLRQTLRVILNEPPTPSATPCEILIVAPDSTTRALVAQEFNRPDIHFIQDRGVGKPAALNLAFQQVRGDLLVLTDGDVILQPGFLAPLLAPFADPKIGAASGQPISSSPRNTMLGYWSHFLVNAAHQRRLQLSSAKQYLDCSGYLYAIRAGLVKKIPANILADDAYISQKIYQADYQIAYAPAAQVAVKYPATFADWLKQKRRSAAGAHFDIPQTQTNPSHIPRQNTPMRGLVSEAWHGFKFALTFPRNPREVFWLAALFIARLYLWLLIKFGHTPQWGRVASTK